MARVRTPESDAVETPLKLLRENIAALEPGKKVFCNNTKDEILKVQRNIGMRRAEIPGADAHLEYIEAMLIAEAEGQLEFKK